MKSRSNDSGRRSSGPRPSARRSSDGHRVAGAGGRHVDRRAEGVRPLGPGPLRVERRPQVGEDEVPHARGPGRRARLAGAQVLDLALLRRRGRWPRTGPGRARRRGPRATSRARCRPSSRGTRAAAPSTRTASVSGPWSVRENVRASPPTLHPVAVGDVVPGDPRLGRVVRALARRPAGAYTGKPRRFTWCCRAITSPSRSCQWSGCSWLRTRASTSARATCRWRLAIVPDPASSHSRVVPSSTR